MTPLQAGFFIAKTAEYGKTLFQGGMPMNDEHQVSKRATSK
jgi:hypothetical protein